MWKSNLVVFNENESSDDSSVEHDIDNGNGSQSEQDQNHHHHHVGTHVVTFKCIGTTKSRDYHSAVKKAWDLMRTGQPEPTNSRDSKALAFVCKCNENNHGWICSQ